MEFYIHVSAHAVVNSRVTATKVSMRFNKFDTTVTSPTGW